MAASLKSISGAAQALMVTPPAITIQVKQCDTPRILNRIEPQLWPQMAERVLQARTDGGAVGQVG